MRIFHEKIVAPLFFILLGCLYIYCTPYTVQSGDTGELVTNSYFLRVSHPPGYPLWTLLYHLPVKYLHFGNPFAVASIFTVFIGMGSLVLLYVTNPSRMTLLVILVLGSASVVWKYFLLPDVFALHCLFLSLLYLVFVKPILLDKWWMIFLISLSVAHHHTIVFGFPLFVLALFKSKITNKKIGVSLLSGIISLGLYFLMLSFNPEDYGSWGNLQSAQDVIHHFLRKDYGTFSLARPSTEPHSWTMFFLRALISDFWSFLILAIYLLLTYKKDFLEKLKSSFIFIICLILYLIVFEITARVSFNLTGETVFERFLVMPLFLLTFVMLFALRNHSNKFPVWLTILLSLNLGLNLWSNFHHFNFKEKTGIHDLVSNSLNQLPHKSILYAVGDSFGFSSYYLNEVQNLRKDVTLIHPSWEFSWSKIKALREYPEIFKSNSNQKFLLSNINENHEVFTNQLFEVLPRHISIGYVGLLFKYSFKNDKVNQSLNCSENYNFLTKPSLKDFKYFDEGTYFSFSYGGCHFEEGLRYLKTNNLEMAKNSLKAATQLSPYNAKYLERLCYVLKLLKSSEYEECDKNLDFLIDHTNPQYYLSKFHF